MKTCLYVIMIFSEIIRILSNDDEEDGVFLVWGNEQGNNDSESSDILSFIYNRNIFHVYLEVHSIPSDCDKLVGRGYVSLFYVEIGKFTE